MIIQANPTLENIQFDRFRVPTKFCELIIFLLVLALGSCRKVQPEDSTTYRTIARPIAMVRQERIDVAFKGEQLLFLVVQEFANDPGQLSIEFDGDTFLHAKIIDEKLRLTDLQSTPNMVIVMEDGKLISASVQPINGEQINVILKERRRWVDQVLLLVRGKESAAPE